MNSESSITVIVICIINQLLDKHSLIVSSNGVAGQQYLPFIAHDSSWNQYTNVDDGYRYVELPFNVSFGTSRQNGVYIGSNGYITFKTGYDEYISEQFPINRMMVSPYWTDIDLESPNGIVFYKIFDESLPNNVINDIESFLNDNITKPVNTVTASLVVKWINVCPFGNSLCSLGNTFQLVLTSDSSGEESYAIFTYKCGDLNWLELPTTIGYSADDHFYHNHYLSRQSNVNSIACVNLPQSNWSNVLFKLSIDTLPFLNLPASAASLQNTDDEAVHIPLESNDGQVFFGNHSFTSLYASSNGLVSFGNSYTEYFSIPFPISQRVIAPYWDDIELLFDGSMQYHVVNDGKIKDEVDHYLKANLSIKFDASTVVVVKWLKVCHFSNECSQRNSFQLVLATDDYNGTTYSIFTYKCGLLNWVNEKAVVGFSASNDFYANHRLSQNESVNDIACLNYPASSWSNVVYQVNKIIVELSIQEITSDVAAVYGSSVSLNCTVTGIPRPYIQWEGSEEILSNGVSTESLQNDGSIVSTLTIISLDSNATFNCTAWNNYGDRVTEQAHVTVQIEPVVMTPFMELSILIGQPITLTCSVYGYPIPIVQWKKKGSNVNSHAYIHQQSTITAYNYRNTVVNVVSFLTINDSTYEDGGEYVCHAENHLAKHIEIEHSIARIFMYSYINVFISQDSLTTTQGSNVTIECIITGVLHPSTNISWQNHDTNSLDTSIVYINTTTTLAVLTISSVTLSNKGNYICTAANIFDHSNDSVYITVQVPPTIMFQPTMAVNISIGDRVTLTCTVAGYPIPTVYWKKDGDLIITQRTINTIFQYNNTVMSTLIIEQSMYNDTGEYVCYAENDLASHLQVSSKSATLLVYSEVQIARMNEKISIHLLGESIILSCLITGVPRPCVEWHHDNEEIPNSHEEYLNISTILTLINITLASHSDEGEYTCSAWNDFGENSSEVMTIIVQALENTGSEGVTVISTTTAVVSTVTILLLIVVVVCIVHGIKRYKQRYSITTRPTEDSIQTHSNTVYGMHVFRQLSDKPPNSSLCNDEIPTTINPMYELVKPSVGHITSTNIDDQNHYDYARYTFATTIQPQQNATITEFQEENDPVYLNVSSAYAKKPCALYENVNF